MPAVAAEGMHDESYRARLASEKGLYEGCLDVHDLPPIFHYWSERYVRPKLEAFGFSSPNAMFQKYILEQCESQKNVAKRFVSIGSGNCDLEIALASHLRGKGHEDFVIDCLDLNPAMLERGRASAAKEGVPNQIQFVQADFNEWNPEHEYDAVIANQALHHVLKLEHLFGQVKRSLKPHGSFIISEIVGRNGHLRWPEALEIVHEFWRRLPPSYRFNHRLHRYEELFEDWDCAAEGFEGIRSQDILALLVDQFHFQLFIAFANVINPFVDRFFGPNFDAGAPWDRSFIDQVHARDEEEILSGRIKPTHILAVLGTNPRAPLMFHEPLTPQFCLRSPDLPADVVPIDNSPDAYDWRSWPHSTQSELEIACRRLKEAEDRIKARNARTQQLDKEVEQRTAWAQRMEKELAERTVWALQLDKEVQERTQWAHELQRELENTAWLRRLYHASRDLYHGVRRFDRWFRKR